MKSKDIIVGEHYAYASNRQTKDACECIIVAKRENRDTPTNYNYNRDGTTIGIAFRRGATDEWYPAWVRPRSILGAWSEVKSDKDKINEDAYRVRIQRNDGYGQDVARAHHLREVLKPKSDYEISVKYNKVELPYEMLQKILSRAGIDYEPENRRVVVKHQGSIYEAVYQMAGTADFGVYLGRINLLSLRPLPDDTECSAEIHTVDYYTNKRHSYVTDIVVEDGEYKVANEKPIEEYLTDEPRNQSS